MSRPSAGPNLRTRVRLDRTSRSSEHRHLTSVVGMPSSTLRLLLPNYGQHSHLGKCGTRHEDALRIRPCVRRDNREAIAAILHQIIGHHAFNDLVITEAQPDPQSLGARPRRESLARERFRVSELAHKIHTLYLAQIN